MNRYNAQRGSHFGEAAVSKMTEGRQKFQIEGEIIAL